MRDTAVVIVAVEPVGRNAVAEGQTVRMVSRIQRVDDGTGAADDGDLIRGLESQCYRPGRTGLDVINEGWR